VCLCADVFDRSDNNNNNNKTTALIAAEKTKWKEKDDERVITLQQHFVVVVGQHQLHTCVFSHVTRSGKSCAVRYGCTHRTTAGEEVGTANNATSSDVDAGVAVSPVMEPSWCASCSQDASKQRCTPSVVRHHTLLPARHASTKDGVPVVESGSGSSITAAADHEACCCGHASKKERVASVGEEDECCCSMPLQHRT